MWKISISKYTFHRLRQSGWPFQVGGWHWRRDPALRRGLLMWWHSSFSDPISICWRDPSFCRLSRRSWCLSSASEFGDPSDRHRQKTCILRNPVQMVSLQALRTACRIVIDKYELNKVIHFITGDILLVLSVMKICSTSYKTELLQFSKNS